MIDWRRPGEGRERERERERERDVREEDEEVVLKRRTEKWAIRYPFIVIRNSKRSSFLLKGTGKGKMLKVNVRENERRGKRSCNGGSLHSVYAQN
jgi:hypothetical protein